MTEKRKTLEDGRVIIRRRKTSDSRLGLMKAIAAADRTLPDFRRDMVATPSDFRMATALGRW